MSNVIESGPIPMRSLASISDVLRLIGALAVASAMGVFLLDGVEVHNDLQRFMTMLGFAGALTAAGLLMNYLLQEQRGSRVFIGLSLVSVPVNFTVLGAMLYSIIPWDQAVGDYPGFAKWTISSVADFGLALPLGAIVVSAVSWFGFSVMARRDRRWLAITLLASNLALLIPVRQDYYVAAIALGLMAILHLVIQRHGEHSVSLKTLEGRIAVGTLFIAPLILVIRSFFLYEVGGYLMFAMAAGVYFTARHFLYRQEEHSAPEVALTIVGGFASLAMAASVYEIAEQWMAMSFAVPLSYATLLGGAWQIARKNPQAVTARSVNMVAIALVSIAGSLQPLFLSSSIALILTAVILVAVLLISLRHELRLEATAAVLGLASLMLLHAGFIWQALLSTGWWGIALAGSLAIVGGSLLEKFGPVLSAQPKLSHDLLADE